MTFTCKIVMTPHKGLDPTQVTTHQTAVKTYLDGASISTMHSITTALSHGFWVTTIVYE